MPIPALSEKQLGVLGQYDTPTICNVIELFGVRPRNTGFMDARIRACFPEMPPAVGYAATATIRTAFERSAGSVYGSLDEQIRRFEELPGPAFVVFQDLDDPAVGATFGEVMCATYQAFGAVGLVTSGAARDLDQVRRLGFSAFSNGAICSHACTHIVSLHTPVRVGGLPVHPGDLLHADANGITNIPHEIASEVGEMAAEYVAAEAIVLDFLKTGVRDCASYSEARKACMAQISTLAEQVRARRRTAGVAG